MSVNNQLKITKEDDLYVVREIDADTQGVHQEVGKYKTLEEAVKMANKYMREVPYGVEYGLDIDI